MHAEAEQGLQHLIAAPSACVPRPAFRPPHWVPALQKGAEQSLQGFVRDEISHLVIPCIMYS